MKMGSKLLPINLRGNLTAGQAGLSLLLIWDSNGRQENTFEKPLTSNL